MARKYIGIDFGGSNLRIAEVNPKTGKIIGKIFKTSLLEVRTNKELLEIILPQIPKKSNIGISAAGNVDEKNLIIKFSPNSLIRKNISFAKDLKKLGHDVVIANDMKSAVQAAACFGEGKDYENVLLATYSSGFNCALTRDCKNMTTAEFGHMIYKEGGDLFCSCGGKGHLETYVSGNGAASMAKQYFMITRIRKHIILENALEDYNKKSAKKASKTDLIDHDKFATVVSSIQAQHIYEAYKKYPNQEPQRSIRDVQVRAIADSFGKMISAYNPVDIIVLMGSQTKDWEELFKPALELYKNKIFHEPSINIPKIVKTKLPEIGVQGAVAYFLSKKK